MTEDQQRQRKLDRQLEAEARWLQKTMFALSKAREAREKLAEAQNGKLAPLITLDDGTTIPLDKLEEIIQKRVEVLMEALGMGLHGFGR